MSLSLSEINLLERQEKRLRSVIIANEKKYKYYYAKMAVKDLGVSTPPRLKYLNEVLGWGSAAVDLLGERIFFKGFYSPDADTDVAGMNDIYRDNFMEAMQRPLTRDSLITGTSYLSVLPGEEDLGEPRSIIRSESPNEMIGDYNYRSLRMDNAIKLTKEGKEKVGILWTPDANITVRYMNGRWFEIERDEHELGFVSVSRVINQLDTKYPNGRTEITRPLRGHIDAGMRTLLNAEIAREFFAMPLRALMGADKNDFVDNDGNPVSTHDLIAGGLMGIPYNSRDDVMPTLTQMAPSNPDTIIAMVEKYAILAAREIGVSPSYFGFQTVNPASADAINEAERKLVNKANERIPAQKIAYKQAWGFSELMMNGSLPDNWNKIEPVFMKPETHTPAASADRITKMISAGVFSQPLPDFVYRELGFDEVEILQLKKFVDNAQNTALIQGLIQNPATPIGA